MSWLISFLSVFFPGYDGEKKISGSAPPHNSHSGWSSPFLPGSLPGRVRSSKEGGACCRGAAEQPRQVRTNSCTLVCVPPAFCQLLQEQLSCSCELLEANWE